MKCAVVLVIAACSRRPPITSCDDDLRGVYATGDERWMVLDNGAALEAYPLFPDGEGPGPGGPPGEAASSAPGGPGHEVSLGAPAEDAPTGAAPADLVVAPRVFDFQRGPTITAPGAPPAAAPGSSSGSSSGGAPGAPADATDPEASRPVPAGTLAGTLRRRYMRRAERCDAHVPVHLTRCAGDTLELVLADPSPPLTFAPCTWARSGPSRLVRWRRE